MTSVCINIIFIVCVSLHVWCGVYAMLYVVFLHKKECTVLGTFAVFAVRVCAVDPAEHLFTQSAVLGSRARTLGA